MKYTIEYRLSFGAKKCTTCNGTGLIWLENDAGDKMPATACPSLTCFDSGTALYTEPRFTIKSKRVFTNETSLNEFCKRLFRLKMKLAFRGAGLSYTNLRDAYYSNPAAFANKFAKSPTTAGSEASRLLPYHNKLSISISRKP